MHRTVTLLVSCARLPRGRARSGSPEQTVTSGKQRFMVFPIDFVGETPLKPGYFTHALTPVPSDDPRVPGGLEHEISKDPTPQ